MYELPETEPKKPKKRGKLLAVILGVIAGIAVIAAAVVLLGGLLPRPGGGNACVYLNRGKYQMITDIKKGEVVVSMDRHISEETLIDAIESAGFTVK